MTGFIMTGTHTWVAAPTIVPSKLEEPIPITVNGEPFRCMVEPTVAGLPAKRFRQKLYSRTATGWPLRSLLSSGVSNLPRWG